ncbi:MAG TPA: ATP-binding protein, partial [Cyclobacteriaceae bacterium]|nr:ATP-binding protein [Cyclobacteriaceae bacterium]
ILDEALKYVFVAGRGLARAAIKPSDLIGERFGKMLGRDVEPFLERAVKGEHVTFEVAFNQRSYDVNMGPILSNLKIKRLLVVVHDITIMKETEARLVKALERERELSELKSRFVTMASHEFRTPLTTIQSSSTLLGMYSGEAYDKEKATHVARIKNSVKLLTEILTDFLSLESLEKRSPVPRHETVLLSELMEQVGQEAEPLKKGTQILELEHSGLDEITTDRRFLKNILYNLLSNAFKYSPEDGKVIVKSNVLNGRATISVVDHGMGIPPEDQEHIFDRFFRAHNVVNIHGTGLGLTVVKKYADLLAGTLTFSSNSEKGTVFTLELPLKN